MSESFNALVVDDVEGKARANIKSLTLSDLPDNDVLVEVAYSSLNYKDGLVAKGNRNKVARKLPMVGGIDLAGTVVESSNPDWKPGDKVICNGFGMSEGHWGGYSQMQRVRGKTLMALPEAFTMQQAMAIGTAGYTAALCVEALENWGAVQNSDLPVLVTGAAGGVGSVAISLLSARGYKVAAATGRPEQADYLKALGATEIVSRQELAEAGGPLQKERWSGVVDSVGSTTLVNTMAQTVYGGAVAACGSAGGMDMNATVLPHILRGVALLGIDSVMAPMSKRIPAWERLARDLDQNKLAEVTSVHGMSEVFELADQILAGQIRGRVVIDVNK